MIPLPRRILLSVLSWTLRRDSRGAAIAIVCAIVCAIAGYYAGRSGFGSWNLGIHDGRTVKFWHEALAPIAAAAFVALWRANAIARRWFRRENVNPTIIALFAFPLYFAVVLGIFAVWSFWTLPLWFAWQVVVLLLGLARPFIRRAIAELSSVPLPAPASSPKDPRPVDALLETANAIARAARAPYATE